MAWSSSPSGIKYCNDDNFFPLASSRTHKINIVVLDRQTNVRLSGAAVKIYYDQYAKSIEDGGKCQLITLQRVTKSGITDNNGMFSMSATDTYYSSEDYIFGTININLAGYYRDNSIEYFKFGPEPRTETYYFPLFKINKSP